MNIYDIAIIGGGASGCMATIWASKNNKSVILFERNEQIGKKVLATGNGRCNLTNINANPARYHGANSEFINSVLKSFDQHQVIEYFENLGLQLKEEDNGRIFPKNDRAASVVNILKHELDKNKVVLKMNSLVRKIEKDDEWKIVLQSGEEFTVAKLIVTTGGKAAYRFGSSGDGYFWAENFGHKITTTYPSLVPLEIKEDWIKEVQGVKVVAKVITKVGDKIIREKFGDVLFTHFGISGPAAMAQGSSVANNISKDIKVYLDLFPEKNPNQLDKEIINIFSANGAKSVKNCLSEIMVLKLAIVILKNLEINPDKKSAEVSKEDRKKFVKYLKNIILTPIGTRSFKEAQVTSGGIDVNEINSNTMESKKISDLYFAGEIVDVDGDSGGFNLQWAWSSGYLAGYSVSI